MRYVRVCLFYSSKFQRVCMCVRVRVCVYLCVRATGIVFGGFYETAANGPLLMWCMRVPFAGIYLVNVIYLAEGRLRGVSNHIFLSIQYRISVRSYKNHRSGRLTAVRIRPRRFLLCFFIRMYARARDEFSGKPQNIRVNTVSVRRYRISPYFFIRRPLHLVCCTNVSLLFHLR